MTKARRHKTDLDKLRRLAPDAYKAYRSARKEFGIDLQKLWVAEDMDREDVLMICSLSNHDHAHIREWLLECELLVGSHRGQVASGEANVCYVQVTKKR